MAYGATMGDAAIRLVDFASDKPLEFILTMSATITTAVLMLAIISKCIIAPLDRLKDAFTLERRESREKPMAENAQPSVEDAK